MKNETIPPPGTTSCDSENTSRSKATHQQNEALRPRPWRTASLVLGIGALLLAQTATTFAVQSVTATKSCSEGSTTLTHASFTISTRQEIAWRVESVLTTGCAGEGFYLSTRGPENPDIALTTTGGVSGTKLLDAGTYHISIKDIGMGDGKYTVSYDRTASVAVTTDNPDFGIALADSASVSKPFTVSKSGDMDVIISGIESSDPAFFPVTAAPTGQAVGPDRAFSVEFAPGSVPPGVITPQVHTATITVSGSTAAGNIIPVTIAVKGTTQPRLPGIRCPAGNCDEATLLGSADGNASQVRTFSYTFENNGTAPLSLKSIDLIGDPAFSIVTTPSLSDVPERGSRTVQIRFAPPPGERDYCGHLVIVPNDSYTPTKRCYFKAKAHHPTPRLRIATSVLDYHEVEFGFSFAKPLLVFNDGDAPLLLTVTAGCPPDDADCQQWSLDLPSRREVPAGPNPVTLLQVFKPTVLGRQETTLHVTGEDPRTPPDPSQKVDVRLVGIGASPMPIDAVLALDRSGSMSDPAGPASSKIQALQNAANLFADLLAQRNGDLAPFGDQIALVKYNHLNSVYEGLGVINPAKLAAVQDALSDAAIRDPNRLQPAGETWIGGAIKTGAGLIAGSSAERKHVLVLLTDGKETKTPYVREVLGPIQAADPLLNIYSVGLGNDADPDVLQQIASVVNGDFMARGDLSGDEQFALEAFYFKIFANATGMGFVVDPTHAVPVNGPSPITVDYADITTSDRSATFVVTDLPQLRGFYNLELVDPRNRVIRFGSTVGGEPVQHLSRRNYRIWQVSFPDRSLASSYVGRWTLRMTPTGTWTPTNVQQVLTNYNAGDRIDPYRGTVPIGFAAAVKSDFKMECAVDATEPIAGATVTLTATLTDRGLPPVGGTVAVEPTFPDGSRAPVVQLFDDASHGDAVARDGVFTAAFPYTARAGAYRFLFRAVAPNYRGELNQREETRYLALSSNHVALDVDGDKLPDTWELQHFGNLQQTALGDPDQDGLSNLREYLADTDPLKDSSVLRLNLARANDGLLRLSWVGGTDVTQMLQFSPSLSGGRPRWITLLTNEPPTLGSNSVLIPLRRDRDSFYRIMTVR